MLPLPGLATVCLLLAACSPAAPPEPAEAPPSATPAELTAALQTPQGVPAGQAVFRQQEDALMLTLEIAGLPGGEHAMRLAAGPCGEASAAILSELPSVIVGPDGSASLQMKIREVTLTGGDQSLSRTGGASLRIDDRAGKSLACGTLGGP